MGCISVGNSPRIITMKSPGSLPSVSSRTIARCGESFLSEMMDETIKMLGEKMRNISGWWYTYPSEKYESQLG